ncbi:MAG TPA: hydrogenase maturation nickel metallochaperone HypA [Sedimenticola sp.]|nr:hydrogenase maturation nickel metallochaperone HypA [Sedimenticola sp.]
MHEFSICRDILAAALEEYRALDPAPKRLKAVRVVAGGMHQIIPEYLATAYGILSRDTPAAGSKLDLVIKPVTGRCRECGWEGEIVPPFFQCAACGALAIDLMQGRELYLDRLEVEDHEHERDQGL